MKVLLLQDVPKVGKKFEVKDVAAGYGRNFLVKKGFAEIATARALKDAASRKDAHEKELRMKEDLLVQSMKDLDGKAITLHAKANEQGHLFAGVHAENIAEAVKDQLGVAIEEAHVDLPEHIKEAGEHAVSITVGEKSATITVKIEGEE